MLHDITHIITTLNNTIPNFSHIIGAYFCGTILFPAVLSAGVVLLLKRRYAGGTQ